MQTISPSSSFTINGFEHTIGYINTKYPNSYLQLNLFINIFDINNRPISSLEDLKIIYFYNNEKIEEILQVNKISDTGYVSNLVILNPGEYKFKLLQKNEELCIGEPTIIVEDISLSTNRDIYGIFPRNNTGVVNADKTDNAAHINTVNGCSANFYNSNCSPIIDPIAMNALLSEIGVVINAAGLPYDCNRLDNLANAIYLLSFQGDNRRYLIGKTTEASSKPVHNIKHGYFPAIMYPKQHLTFLELRNRLINNDQSDEFLDLLNNAMLIDYTFELVGDDKIYFEMNAIVYLDDVLDDLNRHIEFMDRSIAILRIDNKFYLYDAQLSTDVPKPALYSRKNLGTFSISNEFVNLKTESIELNKGIHHVEVFIIQFHSLLFPTDLKYRENYTRLRVDVNNPKVDFKVLRSINL